MRGRTFFRIALLFSLFCSSAVAQFSKTITVTPGVQTIAVTTWYYANCTTSLGVGSFSVSVAPTHGTVAFADVSGPLPGCPSGSPSLPAVQALYTWTDSSTADTSDYFQLIYTVDGQQQVDDINVTLAAPPAGESCSDILTSRTVKSVPMQPDSRTTIGVAEVVELNTTYPATWTIDGEGIMNEPTGGECSLSTSSTPVQGTQACFTAPYSQNQTTITADIEGGQSCSIQLNTIEPSGLVFQRLLAPGYAYGDPRYIGEIGMWSAVFVTPGDVSFANIGIAEQDHRNDAENFTTPLTNSTLYKINSNINAWLIGCDKEVQPLFPTFDVHNWVYTWGSNDYRVASKKEFATVETQITLPFAWLFQKGQIEPGLFNTFIEPAAVLAVPLFSRPCKLEPLSAAGCIADISGQFAVVPMSK